MKLLLLYGPPAVGKYTIAKAISEITGYKLFHNHLTIDLLKSVFEFGTPDFFRLSQKIRLDILEQAAKENVTGVIFTFVYEKGTDDEFIRELINRVRGNGGQIVFVQMYSKRQVLLDRVTQESRKQFQKVKTIQTLEKILDTGDKISEIEFVKSTKVDNSSQTVEETVDQILVILKNN